MKTTISQHDIYMTTLDITDQLMVLSSVKEVLEALPEEIRFEKDKLKADCVSHTMRKSRGSMNPNKVNMIIENLLS